MRTETIGSATLYLGDCRQIIPALASVDAVVTDAPYGIEGGSGGDASKFRKGHYIGTGWEDDPKYIADCPVEVVKHFIALGVRIAITPGRKCAFLYPNPDDIGGFWLPGCGNNGKWGFGILDPILYYGKDPRAGKGCGPSGKVITEPAKVEGHPAAKPISAMIWLVDKASLPGEMVLDPFMGSGTTGIACADLGRRFIGIEREPEYFDLACQRIEDAQRQQRMFA